MSTETPSRKVDVQKLQRAIVNGLEDVKAQDIRVFNTEHLSPLFERVIVASGTSNRQTKALASSVSDAVREAGFPKPRTEGEDNGEWIIVDCGQAVVHVMQPTIRAYYNLEEIWGGKTVRMKPASAPKAAAPARKKAPAAQAAGSETPVKPVARKASTKAPAAAGAPAKSAKSAKEQAPQAKPAAKSAAAKAAPAKAAAPRKPAAKLQTVVVGVPAKKTTAAKTPAKKAAAGTSTRRKPAA